MASRHRIWSVESLLDDSYSTSVYARGAASLVRCRIWALGVLRSGGGKMEKNNNPSSFAVQFLIRVG